MSSSRSSQAYQSFLQQQDDDAVVCAFGPDYFHGARDGSGVGAIFTSTCSYLSYRRLRRDQRSGDDEASANKWAGRRARTWSSGSRWVVWRGFHTQPTLALGCTALAITSILKVGKCYLAQRRCREFEMDDLDFDMLQQLSTQDEEVAALLTKMSADRSPPTTASTATPPRSAAGAGRGSVNRLLVQDAGRDASNWRRPPTYADGIAVGLLGSIMDCFLPMHAVPYYYYMRCGRF